MNLTHLKTDCHNCHSVIISSIQWPWNTTKIERNTVKACKENTISALSGETTMWRTNCRNVKLTVKLKASMYLHFIWIMWIKNTLLKAFFFYLTTSMNPPLLLNSRFIQLFFVYSRCVLFNIQCGSCVSAAFYYCLVFSYVIENLTSQGHQSSNVFFKDTFSEAE